MGAGSDWFFRIDSPRLRSLLARLRMRSPAIRPLVALVVEADQEHHFADIGFRQRPGDRLVMPLHEDVGHDELQHHHRGDHDDQRARIEPLRKMALEKAVDAVPQAVQRLRHSAGS